MFPKALASSNQAKIQLLKQLVALGEGQACNLNIPWDLLYEWSKMDLTWEIYMWKVGLVPIKQNPLQETMEILQSLMDASATQVWRNNLLVKA